MKEMRFSMRHSTLMLHGTLTTQAELRERSETDVTALKMAENHPNPPGFIFTFSNTSLLLSL